MEFEDIQGIWQTQSAPVELEASILQQIEAYRKKIRRSKLGMYISLPATIVFILSMILVEDNPYYVSGILISVVAMILAMIQYKRLGPVDTPKEPGNDSASFVRHQLEQFKAHKRFKQRFMPYYFALLFIGQMVSAAAFVEDRSLTYKIIYFSCYAVGVSIVFATIYYFSRRRYRKKWGPLRSKLLEMLAQLETSKEA